MLQPLETQLAASWPPPQWKDVTVIAAVSGGGDSVALLRAMVAIKAGGIGRLYAAHFNHRLRAEADKDEQFVRELCERLDIPCEFDREAAPHVGEGLEVAARRARYRFLEKTACRLGARFVVTAHTADDQAETVLHRILRGTGLRGLAGIPRVRSLGHASLIRPLLGLRRRELRAYLEALEQPCCCDASNEDVRFTRNRIRCRLLPELERQYNPAVIESLARLGALAGEAQATVDARVGEQFDRCVTLKGPHAARIAIGELEGQPSYLIRELLAAVWRRQRWPMQAMGQRQWDELGAMAAAGKAARRAFPGKVVAETSPGKMLLTRSEALT